MHETPKTSRAACINYGKKEKQSEKWRIFFSFFFEIEGWQANAKAQEAVDRLASFPSDGEEISQPWIEPPTSSLRFERRFHTRESNRRPLWDLGISPPWSSGKFRVVSDELKVHFGDKSTQLDMQFALLTVIRVDQSLFIVKTTEYTTHNDIWNTF